jgi:cell division protein DivIC
MQLLSHIPAFLKNKYVLTLIGFAVWMLFIDRNDLLTQISRTQKLSELEKSSRFYTDQNREAAAELKRRETDPTAYERIAREKFYMKKSNEDLFLFKE